MEFVGNRGNMLINDNHKASREYAEIYQAAHMYYDLNMLQSEIAEKLYLSRPKVSRLLTQARELGIVEIRVNPIIDRLSSLEEKLCEQFQLKDAIVITTNSELLEHMELALTELAARYTGKQLVHGGKLGVVNSNTVNRILNKISFPESDPVEIVQLIGATSGSFSMQDTTLVLNRLALNRENLKVYPLSTPLYVNDLYLKELFLKENIVHSVMQKMLECEIALAGVSAIESDQKHHRGWNGMLGPHQVIELIDRKAVGCICAQYYDINGKKVASEWNTKTMAMDLEDFSRIETRVGVAQGKDKLKAVYGALQGKLLNVLITDSNTASDLLKMKKIREKEKQISKAK